MPSYEVFIDIQAPPDLIWPVLSDVVAWPDWLPTVTSVQPLQGRSLELGSRYTVTQPKLRPATWVVTELVPLQGSPGKRSRPASSWWRSTLSK